MSRQELPFTLPDDWEFNELGVMHISLSRGAKTHSKMSDFQRQEVLTFIAISDQLKEHGIVFSAQAISKLTLGQLMILSGKGDELDELLGDEEENEE